MRILKTFLKRKLVNTFFGKLLILIINYFVYYKWIIWRVIKSRSFKIFDFDPNEIYYIDPGNVQYRSKRARKIFFDLGKIVDGDWDHWNVKWDDHDQVRWLYEKFVDKKEWTETTYYKTYQNYFKTRKWTPPENSRAERHLVLAAEAKEDDDIFDENFRTVEELNYRCHKLNDLMNSIKERGIVPQTKLNKIGDPILKNDNIIIDIARDGSLLFCDGKHRFTIANILGLKEIPVKIGKRHPQWIKFLTELEEFLLQSGKTYHAIKHPDLLRIDGMCNGSMISFLERNLRINKGTLLDLGANLSLGFAKRGFECTATESTPKAAYYLQRICAIENCRIQIIEKDILLNQNQLSYDIVLAFDVEHQFLRNEEAYSRFIEFLKRTKMKYMLLESFAKEELITKNSFNCFESEDLIKLILEHSCLTSYELLNYQQKNKRPIYLLSSNNDR